MTRGRQRQYNFPNSLDKSAMQPRFSSDARLLYRRINHRKNCDHNVAATDDVFRSLPIACHECWTKLHGHLLHYRSRHRFRCDLHMAPWPMSNVVRHRKNSGSNRSVTLLTWWRHRPSPTDVRPSKRQIASRLATATATAMPVGSRQTTLPLRL